MTEAVACDSALELDPMTFFPCERTDRHRRHRQTMDNWTMEWTDA